MEVWEHQPELKHLSGLYIRMGRLKLCLVVFFNVVLHGIHTGRILQYSAVSKNTNLWLIPVFEKWQCSKESCNFCILCATAAQCFPERTTSFPCRHSGRANAAAITKQDTQFPKQVSCILFTASQQSECIGYTE